MMDQNLIHQRDVSHILTNLNEEVAKVKQKYAENPDDPNLAEELQTLVSNAERDLRLKTQAIVRARLSQSRIMPVQYKSFPVPDIQPRSQSVAANAPPLPPLPPVPNQTEKSPLRNRSISSQSNKSIPQIKQPIPPLANHDNTQKKMTTPILHEKITRPRKIQLQKEILPRIDPKDPFSSPPLITDKMIKTYGIEQLTENGLIQNNDIKSHLTGIVTVAPYTYELPQVPPPHTPQYIMDEHKDEDMKMNLRPVSNNLPPQPIEELISDETQQKQARNRSSILAHRYGIDEEAQKKRHRSFLLINGEPDEESADFIDFRRENSGSWELIDVFLDLLKRLCESIGLLKIPIDCDKFIELLEFDPDEVSETRLMRCFIGDHKKSRKTGKYGFGFIGPGAEKKAAIAIQSVFRGFTVRRETRTVKRTNYAAKKIQHWFRNRIDTIQMRSTIRNNRKERRKEFTEMQEDTTFWNIEQPHFILQFIRGHLPTELGRIQKLAANPNTSLAILSRFPLPTYISNYLRNHVDNQDNLHFVVPKQRLPYTLPLEDVLASDSRLIDYIKEIAAQKPIYIFPNEVRENLLDAGAFLDGYLISPLPKALKELDNFGSRKEFLSKGCNNMFITSNEIQARDVLCSTLTDFAIKNLDTQKWLIRTNSKSFGWINLHEIALLERLKKNANLLTSKDLEDPTFKNLLKQNIQDDFTSITNTISTIDKNQLMDDIVSQGCYIQQVPEEIHSNTSVSLFTMTKRKKIIPKNHPIEEEEDTFDYEGECNITGTWENLYISTFERFATIHPAFIIPSEKLRKHAMKYAPLLIKQRLIGDTVIDFWSSNHHGKERITPDTISFVATENCLSHSLAENVSHTIFDETTLKMDNKFTYVQERLVLPYVIAINELEAKCLANGIKIGSNVFLIPDLQEEITLGLVAIADSPSELVNLVYDTLCILSEKVFTLNNDPHALLFSYCTAIEYLKDQVEAGITNTVFMKTLKVEVVEDREHPQLYRFDKPFRVKEESTPRNESMETEEEDNENVKEMNENTNISIPEPVHIDEIQENQKKLSPSVTILNPNEDNFAVEGRRSLLTTPVDKDGRERPLLTASDDEKDKDDAKEDLSDGPAGANVPEESSIKTLNDIEDEEVLTEDVKTASSDED